MERNLAEARRNSFKSPKPEPSRLLAFDLLTEVNRNEGYSNLLLPQALNASKLEERDRSLVTELLYGTIRMQGKHDWVLSQISDRPWSEVDTGIVDVCRMGVHQLHEMRIPDHAAVASTVEVARKRLGESKASFVNALLRSVTRKSQNDWFSPLLEIKDPVERLSIQYSHPQWIVSAYFDLLKDWSEVEQALSINNEAATPTLVSWPGLSTIEDLKNIGGEPTTYSPYGAHWKGNPGALDLIKTRKIGVQDEGSQLVASIFATVAKGAQSILDLCAGPGGKAALLKFLASERGAELTAVELQEHRAALVDKALRPIAGAHQLVVADGRDEQFATGDFDRVLVDAPCTGLGVLRRRAESRWRRSQTDVAVLAKLQRQLLTNALKAIRPGGVVGYATCSPHLAETEFVVEDVLEAMPGVRLLNANEIAMSVPGLHNAEEFRSLASEGNFLRLWPHLHGTDGMFLALLTRD